MICKNCSTENPAGARFCMACGASLEQICPSCGTPAPPDAKFCMACGTDLREPAPGAPAAPARQVERDRGDGPGVTEAELPEERRQVTVLFADLSGYTAVAEKLDPEAVKQLVDRCLRRLGTEVERFGGTVDKYIGDNVMAIFGAPVAHEDDAERAIRAALGMQAAMTEINEEVGADHGVGFELRVGLNTGEVLAGAVGDRYTVTGDTVNVAARLQAAARPGSVTVGERTFRATSEAVEYRELDPLRLKGKAKPVPAWEAEALGAPAPGPRPSIRAESALVGRDDELELMESLFTRVIREERPHLVTVIGQAGVGKTRLLEEFRQRIEPRGSAIFRQGRCLPYGSSVAYWALGEVVRSDAEIVDSDSSEVAWRKLRSHVQELTGSPSGGRDETSDRRAALIARLIGIEASGVEDAESDGEDPERMRESLFSAVRSLVDARAARGPLVLVFEDIHWADDGMLDLIEYLAQWVRGPLLLLCLARDELLERRPSWGGGRRAASSIFLEPLTREETRELVSALLPDEAATRDDSVPLVAERAGGNPLFAREMVRRLIEEDASGAAELPDTVQGVLAARLDSLEPFERRLVQQAAVVGQTFWISSLAGIAAEERQDLARALTTLEEKGIVEPSAGGQLAGEREMVFKHVLIRDVAYAMLPKAVRATKHFEVGNFVEDRAGDRSDEVVALLAEHYGRAAALGEETGFASTELGPIRGKALHFLESAGDAAASFYSNPEAFSHYQAAREPRLGGDAAALARIGEKQGDVAVRIGRVDTAVSLWTESLEHHRREENLERVGDLHRKIGAGLWHKGAGKQAIEHYQKGINLLKDGPPSLELVRLYEEAAWLYMNTGDNMLAIYAAEKALRLAERLGETRAAGRAHGIFGRVFGRIGDTVKARENLERSVELAREADRAETVRALRALGDHLDISDADYPEAQKAYEEGLALAEQVGDLPAQLELRSALATLAVYRADWEGVRRHLDASADLAEGEGLAGQLSLPNALRGLLAWREGDWEGAESQFRRAHEMAAGVGWSEVTFAALYGLATTLRDRGDFAGAETALSQGLDVCERAGLIAQSIQAISQRAVVLTLAGRHEQARETAQEAEDLAKRLHYPVGGAAAVEAMGITDPDPEAGATLLVEAREMWDRIGRPLESARCELLRGRVLLEHDGDRAQEALDAAATLYERLGVPHLAGWARELA